MAVRIFGETAKPTYDLATPTPALVPADGTTPEAQTVPAGEHWELYGVAATVTTTATAGNRTIAVQVTDGSDVLFWQSAVGANIAASQTNVVQNWFIGDATTPIPQGLIVPATAKVKLVDAAAIDAADTISMALLVRKHETPN